MTEMKKLIFIILLSFSVSDSNSQVLQSNFTGVLVPQYICSGTSTRLPYIYRAQVTGLLPNTTYRYFSQACRYSDFGGNNSGAGNPIFINGTNLRYSTATGLATAGAYDSLTTDSLGNYTGWFGFVHTGNARFTAGNYVYPSITLDSAGNGSTYHRFALNDSIFVLEFQTTAVALSGTGLYGISQASPKNVITVYDNVNNTGRPLSMAIVEDDGISSSVMTSLVQYYIDSVDSRNGRWGTVVPNTLPNGVRRVNVHRLSDASMANFSVNATGVWPSGVNTVNPRGGSTAPIRLPQTDIPLSVNHISSQPEQFRLMQNYPNPFNPSTAIGFSIPEAGYVTLKVYDVLGKEVNTLLCENLLAGTHEVQFNAYGIESGVYFYRIEFLASNGLLKTDSKSLVIIK